MSIEILENDRVLYMGKNFDEGPLDINCLIEWPSTITIKLGNKYPDDTNINDAGIVINDKSVMLEKVSINNFPLEMQVMEKLVDNIIYWGFNGEVKMKFTEKNPTRWLLRMKNKFELPRLTWK